MDKDQRIIADLLSEDIRDFMKRHAQKNIADLALHRPKNAQNWPYDAVLDQMKARQKQAGKFDPWLEKSTQILLPRPDIVEQASSHVMARYKASLVSGQSFVDLTMGSGMDSWALSQKFKQGIAIDLDAQNIHYAAHNFKALGIDNIMALQSDAEGYIQNMDHVDCVYIDPQRRDPSRKGHVNFADCQPNLLHLMPVLRDKTQILMIKASPMLDIARAVQELGAVSSVHVVEWRRECREVIFLCDFSKETDMQDIPIHAIAIDDDACILYDFQISRRQESAAELVLGEVEDYLYEPGPAFMKAGGFKSLLHQYGLKKLHMDTHLYTSSDAIIDFPGRIFAVQNIVAANKKEVQAILPGRQANISVRNFPMHVDALKKKLGIKDGGSEYLFACTHMNNKKIMIHGQKIQ